MFATLRHDVRRPLSKMAETATLTATVNDTNELDTMLNATNDTAVDFGDLEHGDFLTFAAFAAIFSSAKRPIQRLHPVPAVI